VYLAKTAQLGHEHPAIFTVSLAFPLAQKTMLLKFDFLKVGQLGHRQSFTFSSFSETDFPKLLTKEHSV